MQETEEYRISATLDKESNEKLNKIAKDMDRSVSWVLRKIIKEFKIES